MSYSGAAPAGPPVKTNGALDFYVAADTAGASDSNAGTIAAPWKTIDHAIDVCNQFDEITGNFIVHVAAATVNPYTVTKTIGAHLLRANIIFINDGAGQGTDGFTVLSSGSPAVAGSSNVQVVRAAGLGVNTFRGKTIEILTGGATGDRRTIQEHTDTTIIPVRNFTAAVAATDTFRIVGPAASFTFGTTAGVPFALVALVGGGSISPLASTTATATANTSAPPGIYFINFQLSPNSSNSPLRISGSRLVYAGCEIGPNACIMASDACIYFGCDVGDGLAQNFIGVNVFAAPASQSWSGWGGATFGGFTQQDTGVCVGFLVSVPTAGGTALSQTGGGTFILLGGELETTTTAGTYAKAIGGAGYGLGTFIVGQELNIAPNAQIRNTNAGAGSALDVQASTLGEGTFEIKLHGVTLTAAGTGTAGLIKGNVRCTIASRVTGTGGSVGWNNSFGAKTYVNGAFSITGAAGNDVTVDNGTTFNAAAFMAAAGDSIANVNGSVVVRTS